MPFTNYANLDYDQIKKSIKDYLRANSNFTDFDFEGSNFSVLIDTLAYNTYINSFNANLAVNEVFLDSATVRENVVSLAKNIGYLPQSKKAAQAVVSFNIETTSDTKTLKLQPELVCLGSANNSTYVFSISEEITSVVNNGVASFNNITVYQGRFLSKTFTVDSSLDQRFILDNDGIDTSTIRAYVKGPSDTGLGELYSLVDNIVKVTKESKIYLLQEVKDENYELIFGDGIFGQKLENGSVITVHYIVTDGRDGNGAESFSYAGSVKDSLGATIVPSNSPITVTTVQKALNGSDIESIDSIRHYAPRVYSSQYRAVTARDYESIIKTEIYPSAEVITVVGGEDLSPPEYGSVTIAIKPKNGLYVSDFDKSNILSKLKEYSVTGINQKIIDIKVLYIELDSSVYYNAAKSASPSSVKTKISNSLTTFGESLNSNTSGARFKYSKSIQVIDESDVSITSNITKVIIRRNLNALLNEFAEYELCYGNRFHVNPAGGNIKSTGFRILGQTPNNATEYYYLTDVPNPGNRTGILSVIRLSTNPGANPTILVRNSGTVDYITGEIRLSRINITDTVLPNGVIEIQAYPESNDIVGLKDLYLSLDISKSKINMFKDVISSGENTSGVVFSRDYYQSSYSNGNLIRN
tara:strand:+ start:690 stop:2609 length:1920 start_codon:yes stop_codon:yes gene_type:complete